MDRFVLWLGTTLFVVIVAAAIYSMVAPEPRSKYDLLGEPPQWPILQRWLWDVPVRDQVVEASGLQTIYRDTEATFHSVPIATARVGRGYRYVPETDEAVSSYRLVQGPAGLGIDERTGELSGTPAVEGRDSVVIEATLESGAVIAHSYPIFVDSSFAPLGRDAEHGKNMVRLLARAAETTLWPSLLAVLVGVGLGVFLGAYAGYYPGVLRSATEGAAMGLDAIPAFLMLFLVAAVSSYDIRIIMLVVGVILLPETVRLVAERVARFRDSDFVEAARELGMGDNVILWSEIVWHNLRPIIVARTAQAFAFAILADITLSYLNLVDQGDYSLGVILFRGRQNVAPLISTQEAVAWWLLAVPVGALILVIAALSLIEHGVLARWERSR